MPAYLKLYVINEWKEGLERGRNVRWWEVDFEDFTSLRSEAPLEVKDYE